MDQQLNDLDGMMFITLLEDVDDPRVQGRCKFKLTDLLATSFCAVLAGCECFTEIEEWADVNETWLREYVGIADPIASHDTYRRILGLIDPTELERIFSEWVTHFFGSRLSYVVIDGKTVNGTAPQFRDQPLTLVSAYDCSGSIVLEQSEAKTTGFGELTEARNILKRLDLKGVLVSGDAVYGSPSYAQAILDEGGHYLLSIKNNAKVTVREIERIFSEEDLSLKKFARRAASTEDITHGRYELRQAEVVNATSRLKEIWPKIKSVIRINRTRITEDHSHLKTIVKEDRSLGYEVNDQVQKVEEHAFYYVSSRQLGASDALNKIRSRWGIENRPHYFLDVVLHEDHCQIRNRAEARNFALLRRAAFNLYSRDDSKGSRRMKMKRSGWDVKNLEHLLEHVAQN